MMNPKLRFTATIEANSGEREQERKRKGSSEWKIDRTIKTK